MPDHGYGKSSLSLLNQRLRIGLYVRTQMTVVLLLSVVRIVRGLPVIALKARGRPGLFATCTGAAPWAMSRGNSRICP